MSDLSLLNKKEEIVKEENVSTPPKEGGEWFFTQEIKLKSDPKKNAFFINLKDFFGFQPDIVGVFKSFSGRNNVVRLGAYMSPEMKKQNALKISEKKDEQPTDQKNNKV